MYFLGNVDYASGSNVYLSGNFEYVVWTNEAKETTNLLGVFMLLGLAMV